MFDCADLLMLHGVARDCPDCGGERVFVPVEESRAEARELCCTDCGAALLADPLLDYSAGLTTHAA